MTATGGTFDITHQYLDDNPSGTSSDDYDITVTIEDDDTGSSTHTVQVSVINVVPTLAGLTTSPIDEAGTSTLSGTILDPGTLDAFTLTVDWGDGSPVEAFSYSAGTTSFSETHEYVDDDPSGTSADDYGITLTVEDNDGGIGTEIRQVTVSNVAPTLSDLTAAADEEGTITLSGTIVDPGILDTFTMMVDWGDGSRRETFNYAAGTTNFLETHTYTESGIYEIAVTLTDDDTGADGATAMS